jgi:hypothetical protein
MIAFAVVVSFLLTSRRRYALARGRLTARMKTMAEGGRNEIGGQSVEHWLSMLNQDSPQGLVATDSVVFTYKGQDLFFVNGTIGCLTPGGNRWVYKTKEICFLVAVGYAAVGLLSEQRQALRLISGSTELAAFSIFRFLDFAVLLREERRDRRGRRERKDA